MDLCEISDGGVSKIVPEVTSNRELYTLSLFNQLADDACSRARVSKSELKGLGANSPPRAARDMGSIALLSPVRADSHINRQLGAAKVSSFFTN